MEHSENSKLCNNTTPDTTSPVKEEEVKTPTPNKPSPEAVHAEALFLSPGKDPEKIFLLHNSHVIFVDHVQNRTDEHGNWHKWAKKSDGTQMLSITFHYSGSDFDEDLTPHLFRSIIPGVYRIQDGKQVIVLPNEYNNGEGGDPIYLNIEKAKLAYEIKHIYLWLHPQRPPAALFVTKERLQIVYHGFEVKGSKRQKLCTSAPNGTFDYVYDKFSETDFITTCFDWQGKPTTEKTLLCKTPYIQPVFRTLGDGKRKYPAKELKPWHILAIELTEKVHVFFSDTKSGA